MLRMMRRIATILLVAGAIAGGVYGLGQTEVGRTVLGVGDMPAGMEGGPNGAPLQTGEQTTGDTSTTAVASPSDATTNGQAVTSDATTSGQAGRPGPGGTGQRPERGQGGEGGAGGITSLLGVVKNLTTIGLMTLIVIAVQKMVGWVSQKRLASN